MNYLYYDKTLLYPGYQDAYSPSVMYPEYQGKVVSSDFNGVYEAIRNIFVNIGLDIENFGTKEWNPLGEYIAPGDTVLIKPNWVLHKNNLINKENSLDCLVTHPSIIRCVLDYVFIALKGTGKIYVGDSPVKDCDLLLLWKRHHYDVIQEFYSFMDNLKWVDLRGPEEERQEKCELNGVKINLGKDSYFYTYSNQKRLRIPNYDYRKVVEHHSAEIQEYYVNELVIKADVIINLPKPKTHRKSGYTGAMKNFVGINYSKEYLPHHTLGDVENGGDEYFQQTILKKHAAWLRTQRDIIRVKSEKHTLNEWYRLLYKYENFIRRIDNRLAGKEILDKVTEGTWYGNDTLWRTVLDLNKIVHYSSKVGNVKKNKQRVVIHLCDMIVSGDREGPLAPSEKEENILLFGTNGVELDALIVRLMHFKISMLRSIDTALKDRLLESKPYEEIIVNSNVGKYDGVLLKNVLFEEFKPFRAANGWSGFIEE